MDKIVGQIVPRPKEYVEMPHGVFAYACLFAVFANAGFQIMTPIVPVTLFFLMLMFQQLAAGREALRLEKFSNQRKQDWLFEEDYFEAIRQFDITTQHMKRLAFLCVILTAIFLLKEASSN